MKPIIYLFLLLLFIGLSCEKNTSPLSEQTEEAIHSPIIPDNLNSDSLAQQVDPRLVSANNRFAVNLFRRLNQDETDNNVFISPLSLSIALTMAYNGAMHHTQNEMAMTLCITEFDREEVNRAYSDLILSLHQCDPDVILRIANSIWIDRGFAVKPAYLNLNARYFYALVSVLDFLNPATLDIINQWASDNTNGKIDKILSEMPPAVMLLMNALYFKADWVFQFDPEMTHEAYFYLPDGTHKTVWMMTNDGRDYTYYFDDELQAVRMPYGQNKLAMYVFLPERSTTIEDFVANLDDVKMAGWFTQFDSLQYKQFIFGLPKFKMEYEKGFNQVLAELGMPVAFTSGADFTGISELPLWIGMVLQKTFIEVNEQGSEAAAVSAVGIVTEEFPVFVVRRPFFFIIRDDRSGSILFMGKIVNPEYEN